MAYRKSDGAEQQQQEKPNDVDSTWNLDNWQFQVWWRKSAASCAIFHRHQCDFTPKRASKCQKQIPPLESRVLEKRFSLWSPKKSLSFCCLLTCDFDFSSVHCRKSQPCSEVERLKNPAIVHRFVGTDKNSNAILYIRLDEWCEKRRLTDFALLVSWRIHSSFTTRNETRVQNLSESSLIFNRFSPSRLLRVDRPYNARKWYKQHEDIFLREEWWRISCKWFN